MGSRSDAFRFACQAIVTQLDLHSLRGWRHHSLGMLQAELTGNLRVHLWHPSLRVLPEGSLRNVHDHRFDLFSYIAHGTVIDVPYDVRHLAFAHNGATPGCVLTVGSMMYPKLTDCYEIAHAKVQTGDGVFFSRAAYEKQKEVIHEEGESYFIGRRDFHTSVVRDLAVTIVARASFDADPARVLGDGKSGMVKDSDTALIGSVISAASIALNTKVFHGTV
jgi:hypothetical protein